MQDRTCPVCNTTLEGRPRARYCSRLCFRWAKRHDANTPLIEGAITRSCQHCHLPFNTTGWRQQRFCTERCRKAAENARRRQRAATTETGIYIAALKEDPCAYCGAPAEQLDHIDPRSRGGADAWDNLTPACSDCNATKNDLPLLPALLYLHASWELRSLDRQRKDLSEAWAA